jgi:hypothetical protein
MDTCYVFFEVRDWFIKYCLSFVFQLVKNFSKSGLCLVFHEGQ